MLSRRSGRSRDRNSIAEARERLPPPRFDLTATNPPRAGLSYPVDAIRGAIAGAGLFDYDPESFGSLAAREHLVRELSLPVAAPDVLLTGSTSEAYSYLFKLLCDPGEAILVPAPSYPLFEHLAEVEGVELRHYRLAYDGAWHIDLDSAAAALTPTVKAIVVVAPNNPTGSYVRPGELERLASFGVPIVSDEVFAPYPLDVREAPPSALAEAKTLTFVLDGLSKRCGLPQMKLAWTCLAGPEAPRREARERLELIADLYLSPSAVVQHALPGLLESGRVVAEEIRARCRRNLERLRSAASGAPLDVLRAEAGWSAVLRLPAVASEEQMVLELLERDSVLVQPGWFYDFETEPYAVLSLLTPPAIFDEGVELLVARVRRFC